MFPSTAEFPALCGLFWVIAASQRPRSSVVHASREVQGPIPLRRRRRLLAVAALPLHDALAVSEPEFEEQLCVAARAESLSRRFNPVSRLYPSNACDALIPPLEARHDPQKARLGRQPCARLGLGRFQGKSAQRSRP